VHRELVDTPRDLLISGAPPSSHKWKQDRTIWTAETAQA
jgi:hypothetical protein